MDLAKELAKVAKAHEHAAEISREFLANLKDLLEGSRLNIDALELDVKGLREQKSELLAEVAQIETDRELRRAVHAKEAEQYAVLKKELDAMLGRLGLADDEQKENVT